MFKYENICIGIEFEGRKPELKNTFEFEKKYGKDSPMAKYGILFDDDAICVANAAPDWYKALAYTHELLCATDGKAHFDDGHCREVEKFIVIMIQRPGIVSGEGLPENLLKEYVDARIQMFNTLILSQSISSAAEMQKTIDYLESVKARSTE